MSKIARPDASKSRPKKKSGSQPAAAPSSASAEPVCIRAVRRSDVDAVSAIDARVTGIEKRDYFHSLYQRYADAVATGQHFLVATRHDEVIGFVIGEVRDWEFGSAPCGWVFAIDVRPDDRLGGTATQLLNTICQAFRAAGVSKVRTLLARENTLILSFFRSQGMMIAPFIPLEMDLEI